ncbi:putative Ig domain-containing protein [Flocculibacter collagenilyticus]|uniref:putative Ig domain-containing protein n=1 Tax=Flocculibacter collagenilyticus TaxID=2744479 RepID=UPI0018F289EF|nr:putative Ig domain-containing protein [Flocculibacter collagenilyticus]
MLTKLIKFGILYLFFVSSYVSGLTIETYYQTQLNINYSPNIKVSKILEETSLSENLIQADLKLHYNNQDLDPALTLSDYNIDNHGTVELYIKPRTIISPNGESHLFYNINQRAESKGSGSEGSDVTLLYSLDDYYLLLANDGVHGKQLWSLEKKTENLNMLTNVQSYSSWWPSPISNEFEGIIRPYYYAHLDGYFFFSIKNSEGNREPWYFDSKSGTIKKLVDEFSGEVLSWPKYVVIDGLLYYFSSNSESSTNYQNYYHIDLEKKIISPATLKPLERIQLTLMKGTSQSFAPLYLDEESGLSAEIDNPVYIWGDHGLHEEAIFGENVFIDFWTSRMGYDRPKLIRNAFNLLTWKWTTLELPEDDEDIFTQYNNMMISISDTYYGLVSSTTVTGWDTALRKVVEFDITRSPQVSRFIHNGLLYLNYNTSLHFFNSLSSELKSVALPSDIQVNVLYFIDNNFVAFVRGSLPNEGEELMLLQISANNSVPYMTSDASTRHFTATSETYVFEPGASDIDGDNLTYTIVNKPEWLEFNAQTGILTGIPTERDKGVYSGISICVNDGQLESCLSAFSIIVGNIPPKLMYNVDSHVTFDTLEITTANEPISVKPVIRDLNSEDTHTFELVGDIPDWLKFNKETGEIHGQSPSNDGDSWHLSLGVNDGHNETIFRELEIIVEHTPAQFTISMPHLLEVDLSPNAELSIFKQNIDLKGSALEGEELQFGIINKPSWLHLNESTGEIYGEPTTSDIGSYPNIVISLESGDKKAYTKSFTIYVNAYNHLPVANDDTASLEINSSIIIDVLANDEDPEGTQLTIQNVSTDFGTVRIIDNKIEYSSLNSASTAKIDYQVSDASGGVANGVVIVQILDTTTDSREKETNLEQPRSSGGGGYSYVLCLILLLMYRSAKLYVLKK